ncbi:MAG: methylthioribulose 1-phosphate dehydratase [Candidatus Sericytochromatia bacterium]
MIKIDNYFEKSIEKNFKVFFEKINIKEIDKNNFIESLVKLIDLIKNNYKKGYSPATSTNFSFEIISNYEKKLFCMTRSSFDKEFCSESDFIIVEQNGEVFFRQEDYHKPSAECLLHLEIYNIFSDTKCILHSHSLFSTLLSKKYLEKEKITFNGYELQKGIRGVETHEKEVYLPILENDQDMSYLAKKTKKLFQDKNNSFGLLLSAHGLYVWGNSLAEAKRHLETYEFLLEATYMNKILDTFEI